MGVNAVWQSGQVAVAAYRDPVAGHRQPDHDLWQVTAVVFAVAPGAESDVADRIGGRGVGPQAAVLVAGDRLIRLINFEVR